jgi:hypothetical protein
MPSGTDLESVEYEVALKSRSQDLCKHDVVGRIRSQRNALGRAEAEAGSVIAADAAGRLRVRRQHH